MDLKPRFEVGQTYGGFTFTKVLPTPELQLIFYELRHEGSGAKVIHLANDDRENLFCLSFKTLPSDSKGVAHILEHTVLCGSKKFPVKDPFFSMARRSLSTFMNALTGADFTCYPAASQVEKDFYNLLSVYLDAVFFPALKPLSFLQEGHRLEFEKSDDPTSPLIYKGVVFNEMKGSLSSPETRLWQAFMRHLTPDLTYAFNSGGDPAEIPNLTYEELKHFHETYYHPSNCLFFFYGNLPLENHLNILSKTTLKGVKKAEEIPPIPAQKRFSAPLIERAFYPLKDEDQSKKTFIAFGLLTASLKNQQDALALALIDSILMETDASPLKEALLKSQLCTQADSYLDTDMSEIPFVIICRGCDKDNGEPLRRLIFKTLNELVQKGIDEQQVAAAIHQLKFSRLEISSDYGPFGLTLFMRIALAMQHGCDPEKTLTIYSQFKELEKRIEDPNYLTNLITKYLIDNPHFLQLTMEPSNSLEEKEQKEEKERLKKIESHLTEETRNKIIAESEALKKYQEKTEDQSLESLPKIELFDIPKEVPNFYLHHEQQDQLCVFHHDCFTNHIVYADLIFDLPALSLEDLPYVQLLITLLPELGMGDRDYRSNLEFMNAHVGGFGASLHLHPQIDNPSHLRPSFSFRGKALSHQANKLFTLFRDICRSPRLDENDRIKELILQIHTSQQNKLNRNALSFAIQQSLSSLTLPATMSQKLSGLDYFLFIRDLAQNLDHRFPDLIEKLSHLKNTLFHFRMPHLTLSCDQKQQHDLSSENYYGLGELPSKPYEEWHGMEPIGRNERQARVISAPIAFSALGFKTCNAFHTHAPALSLATHIFENTLLHKKIREQGGAYGSGASYNPICGHFYFYSYRDPHIASTYQTFQEAIERLANGKFTTTDLEEAKIGLIQDSDTPISPGSRASVAYTQFREGRSKAIRQEYRDHILNTKKNEIKDAVQEELQNQIDKGIAVTFSSKKLIEKENEFLPEKFPILDI